MHLVRMGMMTLLQNAKRMIDRRCHNRLVLFHISEYPHYLYASQTSLVIDHIDWTQMLFSTQGREIIYGRSRWTSSLPFKRHAVQEEMQYAQGS